MYPVFPPAQGACVDFAHRNHLRLDAHPDLLLLPSPLAPSASIVPFDQGAQPQAFGFMQSSDGVAACLLPLVNILIPALPFPERTVEQKHSVGHIPDYSLLSNSPIACAAGLGGAKAHRMNTSALWPRAHAI
jgi:hypothetical protein